MSAGHGIHLAEFPTTVGTAEACHAHDIAVIMVAPNLVRGGAHSENVAASDLANGIFWTSYHRITSRRRCC